MGRLSGRFGGLSGEGGGALGLSWAILGRIGSFIGFLTHSMGRLGGIYGPFRWSFWSDAEPSWQLLGPFGGLWRGRSWGSLGRSWGLLGPFRGNIAGLLDVLGAQLGASWATLARRKAEKEQTPKSCKICTANKLC